jgi:mRNA-degrading endonuclease YafQ of YafQ-DinJ toxin-antitoxin module
MIVIMTSSCKLAGISSAASSSASRHPSLQAKKMKGFENRWEARVTLHYRLIFSIEGNAYVLLRVGTHDLLR